MTATSSASHPGRNHRRVVVRRTVVAGAVGAGLAGWPGSTVSYSAQRGRRSVSTTTTTRFGDLELIALLDASGAFPASWQDVFTDATEADWAKARALDPEAFGDDGLWHLDFHCYAVRRPDGRVMLVDSGIGPAGSPASSWAPVPGRLPSVLTEAGIGTDDVDLVVMTHLHEDHVGWAVGADGVPMFPNARYVVQRDEVDHLASLPESAVWGYVVEPLLEADQLQQVDGLTRLSIGDGRSRETAVAVPTPGHTVGHQSVAVAGRDDRVIITGDVLVHGVQLVNPSVAYHFEDDQQIARSTRRRLLRWAARTHSVLATAHLHEPFIRVGDETSRPLPTGR